VDRKKEHGGAFDAGRNPGAAGKCLTWI